MTNSTGALTLESMSQAVWYNRWTLHKFQQFLGGEMLEVGCGIGNFTKTLAEYGKVTAIDINEEYIRRVQNRLKDKVNVGMGDIETGKYFFENKQSLRDKSLKQSLRDKSLKKFDSIVCLNVLEHIKEDGQALKNLYKLLKNEGFLILLVPTHPSLFGEIDKSIGHFRRYTKKEILNKLTGAGFEILESRKLNFLGAIGWYISGKIFKEDKVEEEKIKMFNFLAPLILSIEDLIEPPIGTSILVIAQKGKRL